MGYGDVVSWNTYQKYKSNWRADAKKELQKNGYDLKDVSEIWDEGRIRLKGEFYCSSVIFTSWKKSKWYRRTTVTSNGKKIIIG